MGTRSGLIDIIRELLQLRSERRGRAHLKGKELLCGERTCKDVVNSFGGKTLEKESV